MRRTLGQIRAIIIDGTAANDVGPVSTRVMAGVYLGRLGIRILKQWARDRCPQQAAALAFQTALGLVPLLAVAFTLLRSTGSLDAESQLLDFITTQMLPALADVKQHLQVFSEKVSTGAAGAGGLAITLATCYALYASVEKIFNDIWRASQRRALVRKFLTFYALVTLLPVLAAFYLYWSGKLITWGPAARFFGPLLIQFAALLMTNKLLPTTVVQWRAALAAALFTGFALEAVKWGFVHFAKRTVLSNYSGIYGPLALVPLVLVWIYVSWLLVLLGAEIANAIQNLKVLEAEDRRHRGEEPTNGLVAAQLLALISADFERGGQGMTRAALSQEFGLSADVIDRICARLKTRSLVAEVQGDRQGYIPGRPPASITLAEVLAVFRSTDLEIAQGAVSLRLAGVIRDLDESRRSRIGGVTIQDLIPVDTAESVRTRRAPEAAVEDDHGPATKAG